MKQKTHQFAGLAGGKNKDVEQRQDNHTLKARQAPAAQEYNPCKFCRFFHVVPLKNGRSRIICHLNGERYPIYGQACHFMPGKWLGFDFDDSQLLTEKEQVDNLDFPNLQRPGNGLVHNPIMDSNIAAKRETANQSSYVGITGKELRNIGGAKRPHARETAAASVRPGSVYAPPFAF